MKLGKIFYSGELVNHSPLNYIEYVNSKDQAITNTVFNEFTTPTLIVGWSLVKEMIAVTENIDIKSNITILDKKIVSKSLYWEYAFEENKHLHINGVSNFVENVPDYYFSSRYTYINIDPVFFSIESINDLMNCLPNLGYKIYNHKNEMLYILYNNKISGIDLKLYQYFDFDIKAMLDKLKEKASSYMEDTDGSIYQSYYRDFPLFDNLKRYIIVFLSNR